MSACLCALSGLCRADIHQRMFGFDIVSVDFNNKIQFVWEEDNRVNPENVNNPDARRSGLVFQKEFRRHQHNRRQQPPGHHIDRRRKRTDFRVDKPVQAADVRNGKHQLQPDADAEENNEQQAVLIDKALEAAGLGATDDNINIVKELLGLGMPVDAQTLGNMVKYSMKFPEASLNTIANLMRLEIPVNEQNIREFQMYGQFNGHIENLLSDMENGIVNDLLKNNQDIMDFKNVITGMYEGLDGETVNSSSACDVLSQQTIDELNNMLSDSGVKLNNDISETSVKELINQLAENNSLNSDNFQKIINSGSFREILHAVINDTMKLTPKDIQEGEEAVSSYYKRIRKNVENIENSLKSAGNSAPELSKSLSDIKSNIDFMNDLNKNMTYFQMPVKFSKSEGNGELYVFTNKKNLAGKTDNISAMLHLDMDNLKSMDIYVNLSGGNNVSTNFVLETEELLDFVYQHIDRLNARLEKLGYNTHFEMKVAADSSDRLDFVKDFIEAEARPAAG